MSKPSKILGWYVVADELATFGPFDSKDQAKRWKQDWVPWGRVVKLTESTRVPEDWEPVRPEHVGIPVYNNGCSWHCKTCIEKARGEENRSWNPRSYYVPQWCHEGGNSHVNGDGWVESKDEIFASRKI